MSGLVLIPPDTTGRGRLGASGAPPTENQHTMDLLCNRPCRPAAPGPPLMGRLLHGRLFTSHFPFSPHMFQAGSGRPSQPRGCRAVCRRETNSWPPDLGPLLVSGRPAQHPGAVSQGPLGLLRWGWRFVRVLCAGVSPACRCCLRRNKQWLVSPPDAGAVSLAVFCSCRPGSLLVLPPGLFLLPGLCGIAALRQNNGPAPAVQPGSLSAGLVLRTGPRPTMMRRSRLSCGRGFQRLVSRAHCDVGANNPPPSRTRVSPKKKN